MLLKNFRLCLVRELGFLEPLHLNKDVVMFPAYMAMLGWQCTIASYKDPRIRSLKEWRGVTLKNIGASRWPFRFGSAFLGNWKMMLWLVVNARKIDLLMCMHIRRANVLFVSIYRFLNRSGMVFLKTDTRPDMLEEIMTTPRFRKDLTILLERCDVVGFESTAAYQIATSRLGAAGLPVSCVRHIPNGFDDVTPTSRISVAQKENTILSVGRIGAREKNYELLLHALDGIRLDGWKVIFVGPVERDFARLLEEHFSRNPDHRGHVTLAGLVEDRAQLYEFYNKAKVFCLTSHWENFPLALAEALYFDDYIISTDVGASRDVILDGRNGEIVAVNDTRGFSEALSRVILRSGDLVDAENMEYQRLKKQFLWSKITRDFIDGLVAVKAGNCIQGSIRVI